MPANNPLLNDDVLINGCRIATGVHGSGTPLVLVHGTPAHSIIWQSLVPVFVDAGFLFICMTWLGLAHQSVL
ncbi:hypothetical protein MI048_08115 [Pantoea agglomerans]|uniref:alpha/beta fold hydrolase n=1 Tax=Enterobacter agglomerans TaxID=549 RepID=UPI00311F573D